ncbi:MAG TPA: polysulfide reductase NrfD [Thermoanaerobaculales bacterium]|nr:polysulfide reductase NrfD [Thermoanaerobaculales bacterium]HPA79914.1 polysulfide reductase NrfD [Thermoanaerobaculales bacterium]HQL30869.1 polysulfide reductase NrfD [Thermoanaerobaculales bacterium]HQN96979.1 polysulfide reductase NrfD [Thermoanaerobaculales bacterium]HQP42540.1 polysulfide reductase NrfD [Thermoanaerobaculales bacterium]
MLEKALAGGRGYWTWVFALLAVIGVGAACWHRQLTEGLTITGLSRDVVWGLYIAQFTFLVGVAASAVMVVLPYYMHDYRAFGRITILGELLAVAAVIMCMLFIFVDMGMPTRILNVFLYPSPRSMIFWDVVALGGYLVLNTIISRVTLGAERRGDPPPAWLKPIIILSIPWAVSIHTVTAFLYSGLAARPFWLTAILAPRFLASAFASGPALLILLAFVVRRVSSFDPGREAIRALGTIVTYAMIANVFFIAVELFTALYSGVPEQVSHFAFLFMGVAGEAALAPWMWASAVLAVVSLVLLLSPSLRGDQTALGVACAAIFASVWIDKGLGMVIAGFVPSPLGAVAHYSPTAPELMIGLAIWAAGLLILTALVRIVLVVRGHLRLN